MRKDPTLFRLRFQRWKNGEQVYDAGLPKYEDGKDPIVYDTYKPEIVVTPNQPLHFSGHTYSEAWNLDLKDQYYSGLNVRNARSAAVPYLTEALTLPWTLEGVIAAPGMIKSVGSMFRHPMQTGRAIKAAWRNIRTPKINTDPEDIRLAADWTADEDIQSVYRANRWKDYLTKSGAIKSNTQVYNDINKYKTTYNQLAKEFDSDLRFKFFEPKDLFDLDVLEDWEVGLHYGPNAKKMKLAYDIAKRNGNLGAAQNIRERIQSMFSVGRDDADIAAGLQDTYDLYNIPEYRQRFKKFGTLGDTFIDDAINRLDNVLFQGVLNVYGQGGINGGAGASLNSPSHGTIYMKNYNSSRTVLDFARHEAGHISHGMNFQPAWMKRHNESIRPVPKTTDGSKIATYYEDMDEIVTRSKTAVEYANKHRRTGETLNLALDRLADDVAAEGGIYNKKYPADIRQMISHFTLPSVKTFWKGFVGSTLLAIPFAKQNNAQ